MRRRAPARGTVLRRLAPGLLALALGLASACDADGGGAADVPAGGDPSPGDLPGDEGPVGDVPGPDDGPAATALAEANRFRAASGLDPVDRAEALERAAQAHADFVAGNCARYGSSGLSPHLEDPSWPGFTGEDLADRALAAGYRLRGGIGEIIAFEHDPAAAVQGWVDTLYHRVPLLDPNAREAGYGLAALGAGEACAYPYRNADVMEVVSDYPGVDGVALYPPDGARLVPTSFWGREVPQPPRPPAGWPSGSIVTVHFGRDLPLRVTGHRLLGAGDADLPHFLLASAADPAAGVAADPNLHDGRVLALYSLARMATGTDHRVVLDLVRDGAPLHLEWTFRTAYKANN